MIIIHWEYSNWKQIKKIEQIESFIYTAFIIDSKNNKIYIYDDKSIIKNDILTDTSNVKKLNFNKFFYWAKYSYQMNI